MISPRALKRLVQVTDGVTADIFAHLTAAAALAIETEREAIDDEVLAQVGVPVPLLQKVTVRVVKGLQWFAALHKIFDRCDSIA